MAIGLEDKKLIVSEVNQAAASAMSAVGLPLRCCGSAFNSVAEPTIANMLLVVHPCGQTACYQIAATTMYRAGATWRARTCNACPNGGA